MIAKTSPFFKTTAREFGYALRLSSNTPNYHLNLLGQMYVWQGLLKEDVSWINPRQIAICLPSLLILTQSWTEYLIWIVVELCPNFHTCLPKRKNITLISSNSVWPWGSYILKTSGIGCQSSQIFRIQLETRHAQFYLNWTIATLIFTINAPKVYGSFRRQHSRKKPFWKVLC